MLVFLLNIIHARANDNNFYQIHTKRISERVLILYGHDNSSYFSNNSNIVAVKTQKGLVVIDTHFLPEMVAESKKEIESIFKRNDYIYVINTHEHLEHLAGNYAYPEAAIVAHENIVTGVSKSIPQFKDWYRSAVAFYENKLKDMKKSSNMYRIITNNLALIKKNQNYCENEFQFIPPSISFSDRLLLDCGDITLKLIYFGQGHSSSDILIYIPEEKLLAIGSACVLEIPPKIFPNPDNNYERWISVLTELLDQEEGIEHIITGHVDYKYMKKEDLVFIRDYFKELYFVWSVPEYYPIFNCKDLMLCARLITTDFYCYVF